MARYGQTSLGIAGRWLPTWLPEVPLAWLMFDSSNPLSTRFKFPRALVHTSTRQSRCARSEAFYALAADLFWPTRADYAGSPAHCCPGGMGPGFRRSRLGAEWVSTGWGLGASGRGGWFWRGCQVAGIHLVHL